MNIRSIVKFTATLVLAWLLVIDNSVAASINYCHDEAANQEWERLANTSTEPEVKELYALRKELCNKVEAGEMELDTAIDLFESERVEKIQAIKRRKMRLEDTLDSSDSAG
jgi:hypothetical protein